jgi:hypothetical protein
MLSGYHWRDEQYAHWLDQARAQVEARERADAGPSYHPDPHPERVVRLDAELMRCPCSGAWKVEGQPCPVCHR